MSNRIELDIKSQAAMRHGLFLKDAANGLYVSEGRVPGYSVDMVDGTTSYSNSIYPDSIRGISEKIRDGYSNTLSTLIGQRGIYGFSMHTEVDDLVDGGHSFKTSRDKYASYWGGRYGEFKTTVFEPTKKPTKKNRFRGMEIIENPELALQFCDDFLDLTPDNIIIERRQELSEKEESEFFGTLLESFGTIARSVDTKLEDVTQKQQIVFKLPDNLKASLRYTPSSVVNLATRQPLKSPSVSVWIESSDTQTAKRQVFLQGFELPGGSRSVDAYVMTGSSDTTKLRREEIIALMGVVQEFTGQASKGRIRNDADYMTESIEMSLQPEADIPEETLKMILDHIQR